jgi:phosphatidate cytidylyltransferase
MKERNLLLRAASAVVGLPLVGALVLWREPWGFGAFALLIVALGLVEFTALATPDAPASARAVVVAAGVGFSLGTYLQPDRALIWLMLALLLVGIATLVRTTDVKVSAARLFAGGFGILYVGGLVTALPLMHRDLAQGPLWVVTAIAVTFSNDTGAYFTGRALGRHKLAPAISPGKTVEGAVGGLAFGLAMMFVARATYLPIVSVTDALVIGVGAGVLGPCGDLTESMLKRAVGAKDSGRVIPGHGGVLDRIDALMFVGAFIYLYTRLAGVAPGV